MFNERNQLVTSPAYGAVVAITGHALTPELSLDGPYTLADKAKIPEKQYRTDLSKVLSQDVARFDRLVQIRDKVV
jgi:hypothetical protein